MNTTREETIKRIKTALQRRSGKAWSVTGGHGTAWGWIAIDAPPARRTWKSRLTLNSTGCGLPSDYEEYDSGEPGQYISPQERYELANLLGLKRAVSSQGVSIPAGDDYWEEYVDRAEGRTPTKTGKQYWD